MAPHDPRILAHLGRLYLRQRRWAGTENIFQRALAIQPNMAEAYNGMSVALPRQGRVESVIEDELRAMGLRHDFPEARPDPEKRDTS